MSAVPASGDRSDVAPSLPPAQAAASVRSLERARPLLLGLGGVLFAVGNVMHPLEHSESAEDSPLWSAAHLTFALGGLLIALGLPLLARRMAHSRIGLIGCGVGWFAFVMMPVNAWIEVYVAPNVDEHTLHAIESDTGVMGALLGVAFIGGSLLIAVAAWRTRALPRPAAAAVALGSLVLVALPGLPGKEGWWIIPAAAAIGLGLAAGAGRRLPDVRGSRV